MPSPIRFAGRVAVAAAVCCCITETANAGNWEGADVKKELVDGHPPAAGIVSVAYSFTRDGCRVAALSGSPLKGYSVRVDGDKGPRYIDIKKETPVFSPNGQSIAYCAMKGGSWRWVINGVEGPEFWRLTPTSFAFSADGKRHAYVAVRRFGRSTLVVDGKVVATGEVGKPTPIDLAPVFSPDSKRLAYVEVMMAEEKMRVVLDGKPGDWCHHVSMRTSSGFGALNNARDKLAEPPELCMDFSADSKHFAYSELTEGGVRMVIDGRPQPAYKNLGIDFVFAPDGSDYAYMAYPDGQRSIVRKDSPPFAIEKLIDGTLAFSPDGEQLAFAGARSGKLGVWLDEEVVPIDQALASRSISKPRFSPDSKRLAYGVGARIPSRWVVDGKVGGAGKFISVNGFSFSPDSAHYCYLLGTEEGVSIVVDGETRATHLKIQGAVFLSDGSLDYLASDEDERLYRFRIRGF